MQEEKWRAMPKGLQRAQQRDQVLNFCRQAHQDRVGGHRAQRVRSRPASCPHDQGELQTGHVQVLAQQPAAFYVGIKYKQSRSQSLATLPQSALF